MANTISEQGVQTRTTYVLDPGHTNVYFSGKHMMLTTVRGHFGPVSGTLELDENNFANSEVNVAIDIAGLSTRDEKRDGHLRSGDFFDAETYPTATFKSTKIEQAGEGTFKVTGDLSVRGVTKEVVLDANFEGFAKSPWGTEVVGFTASTTINRKEWGLNWNVALEAGGVLVSEKIKLDIEAEGIKQ
jgi:polyisoprenoid-binding protein YceI